MGETTKILLMRVGVESAATWMATPPIKLFQGPFFMSDEGNPGRTYDVAPDGKRFLMIKMADAQTSERKIVVVQNWFEELKQRVPVN